MKIHPGMHTLFAAFLAFLPSLAIGLFGMNGTTWLYAAAQFFALNLLYNASYARSINQTVKITSRGSKYIVAAIAALFTAATLLSAITARLQIGIQAGGLAVFVFVYCWWHFRIGEWANWDKSTIVPGKDTFAKVLFTIINVIYLGGGLLTILLMVKIGVPFGYVAFFYAAGALFSVAGGWLIAMHISDGLYVPPARVSVPIEEEKI